jgi:hypothetical protein
MRDRKVSGLCGWILCGLIVLVGVRLFAQEEEGAGKTTCGGTERWSLKVLTDAGATSVNYTPVAATVTTLGSISTPSVTSSEARITGIEFTTYRLNCNIIAKRDESDNDYHLTITDNFHTMVGEIPDPVCSQAASSSHVSEFIAARNFVDTYVGTGDHPSVIIAPVVVTGVAFVDIPHGVSGAAPNNMEMHPILDIHFAGGTEASNLASPVVKVTIGPNPFSEKLFIKATNSDQTLKNCMLQLFDVAGNKVAEFKLINKNCNELDTTVDIKDLPKGNYIYRLLNNGMIMYDGQLSCRN